MESWCNSPLCKFRLTCLKHLINKNDKSNSDLFVVKDYGTMFFDYKDCVYYIKKGDNLR